MKCFYNDNISAYGRLTVVKKCSVSQCSPSDQNSWVRNIIPSRNYFKDVLEITLLWRTKSVKARSVFAPQTQKLSNLEHQIKIDISFHRPRNEFTLYERYLCSFRCKRTNARKSRTTTPIFALPVVGEWAARFTSHIFSLYLFDARNISQTNIFLAEEKYTNIFYFTLNSSIYKLESLRPLAASFPVHVGPE